jgi:hypothetical protein
MTLLDCKGIQRELGVNRSSAEAIMRKLPKVQIDGIKKVWVRRADLLALLEESTRA